MNDFAQLLRPLGVATFLRDYLDQRTLHAPADAQNDRRAVFDPAEFDRLLSLPSLAANTLFAIDARRALGPADYSLPNGSSDVLRVLDLFDEGATAVFREADRHHHGLWRLARAFERALEAPAFANIYYAPAFGQSFPAHYDALDVFAVQITGRKTWTLYPRIAAKPLRHEHCYGDLGSDGAVAQVELCPGDLLYIPRGVPHLVSAGEQQSLHISISVTPFTRYDLLRSQLDALSGRDGDHRIVLGPEGAPADPAPATPVALPQGDELARMRRAALLAQVPVAIDHPLRARAMARVLTGSSRLIAANHAPHFVETPGDHLRLLGHGRALGFTLQAQAALALALSGQAFAVADLPGLDDDEARCDLAATLLTNGFVGPLPADEPPR